MCRRITCDKCKKPSFAGCGMHIEQVLRDVPKEERCRCHEQPTAAFPSTGEAKPKSRFWPF